MTGGLKRLYLEDLRVGEKIHVGELWMKAKRIKEFAAEFDYLLTGQAFSAEAHEVIEGSTFIQKELPLGASPFAAIELLSSLRDTVPVTRG